MATLREWITRFWATLGRGRADRDLEEELRLHLELAAEDARLRGASPAAAARAAALDAGGVAPRLSPDPNVRPFEARDFRRLTIAGRLKPGATIAEAQTELSVIASDLERAHPETNRDGRIVVRTELQNRIAQAPPVATLLAKS